MKGIFVWEKNKKILPVVPEVPLNEQSLFIPIKYCAQKCGYKKNIWLIGGSEYGKNQTVKKREKKQRKKEIESEKIKNKIKYKNPEIKREKI